MKSYTKIKNHKIKHLIKQEIKRHQLNSEKGAVKILKNIESKYY